MKHQVHADLLLMVTPMHSCRLHANCSCLLLHTFHHMQGFQSHWYTNRVLQVYSGAVPADPALLLKQVPQQPGLHLWLVKPPCSRTWVPVRLDAADNLQETLAQCLHADGSCGPPGSKQRVLLDLQCRGFAVQIR
jgi:hypothetical protein